MAHIPNFEQVLDPTFLDVSVNNSPLLNPPSQAPPTSKSSKTSKSKKAPKENDRKDPHIWSAEQKQKLLELIIDYTRRGHATDNANLKKDAWINVTNDLNTTFNISLDVQQVQNQKGALRKMYQDFRFMRDQSGFGWDDDCATPTADACTWEELIQAHPRRSFDKLRGKSFPWFDLAEEVFSGAVASGSMAERIFPAATPSTTSNTQSILSGNTPAKDSSAQQMKGLTAAMKRQLAALDEDDNGEDTTSTDHQPSSSKRKRARESKSDIVGQGIQGLISAIGKASEGSKDLVGAMVSIASHRNPLQDQSFEIHPASQSFSEDALDKLRENFMAVVSEEEYVDYVGVLENENKARTFLKLINTTSLTICQKWIHKESLALK